MTEQNLERNLEVYRREFGKAKKQAEDYAELVKKTEKAIKERDELLGLVKGK